MIKYIGITNEGVPLGLSLLDYRVYELYSQIKPYRIRRSYRGLFSQFKPQLLNILSEDVEFKSDLILKFINNAKHITSKLHQLDTFKKRYKNKLLKTRPYLDISDFKEKTSYNFNSFFSEILYEEIETNKPKLVNLLKKNNE